jgi:hypothetical protein
MKTASLPRTKLDHERVQYLKRAAGPVQSKAKYNRKRDNDWKKEL